MYVLKVSECVCVSSILMQRVTPQPKVCFILSNVPDSDSEMLTGSIK